MLKKPEPMRQSFVDEVSLDEHGWTGQEATTDVKLDRDQGLLSYASNKKSRISFWMCDLCAVPADHTDYSFEFKYSAPEYPPKFNFGFLFGCRQFDRDLVDCQAVQFYEQSQIILFHTGIGKEYDRVTYALKPNAKGFVSIVIEVSARRLSLKVNDKLAVSDLAIDGDAGGTFGLFADPPGSTVFFDRIEIRPLP